MEIARSDITGLAMHAVVSRSRAIAQRTGAVALFVIAGGVGLNAIGAIHLLGGALLNNRGVQAAIIISLVVPAVRLFATAWDPRHVLAVKTHSETVTLVLQPTPEPFQLMETVADVEKRLGYSIDLYPEIK